MSPEARETIAVQRRYDRLAAIYDLREGLVERLRFASWRRRLWSKVDGGRILEVGVGTGKNIPYYPQGASIVAIDLSPRMLKRARARASKSAAGLALMDAQALAFPDGSFDWVVASFVFCSVPDPLRGLQDVRRVLRPGGKVALLEHVLSGHPVLKFLMNLANLLVVRLSGANINRDTKANVERAGLRLLSEEELFIDVVKLVIAEKGEEGKPTAHSNPLGEGALEPTLGGGSQAGKDE